MPKNRKLEQAAKERGESLETLIPRLIKGHLPRDVAIELGVYDNAIYYWLRRNGYTKNPLTGEWEKPE